MYARAARLAPALQERRETRMIPLAGASAQAEVVQLGSQRSVNFYTVPPENEGDPVTLQGTPGITLHTALTGEKIRGFFVHKGRHFVVAGASVYEVYTDGTYYDWGTIGSVSGRVFMDSLADDLIIGDGTKYWQVDLVAETVTELTAAPRGRFPVAFNRRMIYQGENGVFFYSDVGDATDIPGLNFATAEALEDDIVAIVRTEDQLWLFGDSSVEVWYDSGDVDNPIQRIPGGVIFSGCGHPFTALRLDNSVWWVERDKDGTGIVRRSQGFNAVRVSTTPVERFTASATNLTAYSYQERGHLFYVLNADQGTWAYDLKTGQWHERAWLNPATGEQKRQRQEFHAFAGGKHIVGDYTNGKLYVMGLDYRTDNGDEIRRVRVTPRFKLTGHSVIMDELYIDCITGVGIDGAGQGTDPQIMLRVAKDGAGFGAILTANLGGIGEYEQQVRFFDLGLGRDWLIELSVSDPVITGLRVAEATVRTGRR